MFLDKYDYMYIMGILKFTISTLILCVLLSVYAKNIDIFTYFIG